MREMKEYLYAKDLGQLQMPYEEYIDLMEKVEEAKRLQGTREAMVAHLRILSGAGTAVESDPAFIMDGEVEAATESAAPPPEDLVSSTSSEVEDAGIEKPDSPPMKMEIADYFNRFDESGRLLNVFKQYYTCLNETCGGTVRITLKDGFCNLWNYDEWEVFAFVDVSEGLLRVAVDSRYTDELKSLNLCETPYLLSHRRSVICVQVDDLNNTLLDILAKAFSTAGLRIE